MEVYENSESVHKLTNFWEQSKVEINKIKADQMTFKSQDLPLARIKKIMKLDEDVKSMMISAEAPILFAKAAEFFIREITLRAWIHTERNKRRTLQRSDITLAVADGDTDQFDFLIDIVPRDEIKTHGSTKREETTHGQPMHQMSGSLNLFGGNTIHLNAQGMSSNQQTLISGIVDQNNMLQASQNNTNIQNQPQVQYLLQVPSGTNLNTNHPTIQIQLVNQKFIKGLYQNMLSSTGGDNASNTSASIVNGTQPQLFALANQQGGHGAVLLQPNMLTGSNQTQLYTTATSSMEQHQTSRGGLVQQAAMVTEAGSACVSTAEGGQSNSNQFVMSVIKRDMDDPGSSKHEII